MDVAALRFIEAFEIEKLLTFIEHSHKYSGNYTAKKARNDAHGKRGGTESGAVYDELRVEQDQALRDRSKQALFSYLSERRQLIMKIEAKITKTCSA